MTEFEILVLWLLGGIFFILCLMHVYIRWIYLRIEYGDNQ